jgi:TonB family protein
LAPSTLQAAPPNETNLRNAETFYQAGNQHRMAGDYEPAKREFREALRLNPLYAEPHNGLGWVYYYSDSPQVAIREFKKATAINPSMAQAYLGLGLTYKNVSKWKDAEKALRMAIRLWHYNYLPAASGNLQKAREDAQKDPDYQQSLAELAEVLKSRGKWTESKLWSDSLERLEKKSNPMGTLPVGMPFPPGKVTVSVLRFARDSRRFLTLPVIMDTAKIDYPPEAKQAGIDGEVILNLSVDASGSVAYAQIISSSGNEALNAAAKGVIKTRFSPPRVRKRSKTKEASTCVLVVKVDFQIEPWNQ